jgi:TetR/AcrR family transcriptional regulator
MADVAERVGIRRASLVHYFPDKRSLYEALLDDLFGDLRGRYESELAGPGSLQERMLRCVDAWAEQVERRPGLLRISLWEMARATPTEDVPLASRVRPIVQQLADVVREGQQAGVFQQVDPVGFVMSVPGTTAFLGLRTDLLGAEIAAPQEPGGLKADLRRWVARVLFVDEASAQRVAR